PARDGRPRSILECFRFRHTSRLDDNYDALRRLRCTAEPRTEHLCPAVLPLELTCGRELVHLRERVQPRERRLGALVLVHARRAETVAAAARALVTDRRAQVVVADEPAVSARGLADPRRVAGRTVRGDACADGRVRLDRLLREPRSGPAAPVPAVSADRHAATVYRLA